MQRLAEYDPDSRKARILERAIGIKVIRHRLKKPAGTAEEIERQFGCKSSRLIMVGDRPLTDIVYGNRNGFLTILIAPLSFSQEPFIVKQALWDKTLELRFLLQKAFSNANRLPQEAVNVWSFEDSEA